MLCKMMLASGGYLSRRKRGRNCCGLASSDGYCTGQLQRDRAFQPTVDAQTANFPPDNQCREGHLVGVISNRDLPILCCGVAVRRVDCSMGTVSGIVDEGER